MDRKHKSFILASALLVSMLSGGCSSGNFNKDIVKGGYVEEAVELDNDVKTVSDLYNLNGGISVYDRDRWLLVPLTPDSIQSKKNNDGEILAINDTACFVRRVDENDYSYKYVIIKDNKEVEVAIGGNRYLQAADFSDYGRLFVIIDSQFAEVDTECGDVKNIGDVSYLLSAFDVVRDCVYYVDVNGLHIYDFKKGTPVETPDVLEEIFRTENTDDSIRNFPYKICAGDGNSIFVGCSMGVYRYVMNENHMEQLIDGSTCAIGNKLKHFTSLQYCEDGSIIAGFDNGEVFKYVYDSDYTNEIKSTLIVYSLDNSNELKQMINNFASSNHDVRVEYKVGHRNGMSYEEALKEFAVLMLSDKAPDIIMLEGLDIENLIEKNMLLDLSESEKNWNKEENLLDNVAKWNESDDGLYCVTTRFRIPAVSAEKNALKDINNFTDYVDYMEKCREKNNSHFYISTPVNMNGIVRLGLECEGNSLIKENKVDKQKIERLYNDCKRYLQCESMAEECVIDMYFAINPGEYSFASAFANNLANENTMALGTINTFDKDLNYVTSLETTFNNFGIDYKYGIPDNDGLFISNCTLGIAAKSNNKKEAVDFLASVLDKDNQNMSCGEGFPVNKDALSWTSSKKTTDSWQKVANNNSEYVDSINVQCLSDNEISIFNKYIETLKEPLKLDYAVREIIETNAIRCMKGELTVSEASDEVERQLNLKMKE